MKMKSKKVFSLFLAMDLCSLGHKIVRLELNKEQRKQVYVFEVNETFEEDFRKIVGRHQEWQKRKNEK